MLIIYPLILPYDPSLVIIKLLIGINLRAYALSRYANMQERAAEDQRNDRSRPHIGVGASEIVRCDLSSLWTFILTDARYIVHSFSSKIAKLSG